MVSKHPGEARRRDLEDLAATCRANGHAPERVAAEIAARGEITLLWAWRLAMGWRRSDLLDWLRRLGDPSVDESMLWRWETGERDPSKEHLDRLCRVYQTRPDRLGYGHDYSQPRTSANGAAPDGASAPATSMVIEALEAEPLAMVRALTVSTVSTETLAVLECTTGRLPRACQTQAAAGLGLALDLGRQYRAVRIELEGRQRVAERRRLAAVAARLGSQLGLLLWEVDRPIALAFFDAAMVAARESDEQALVTGVTERRASVPEE
jgi:transcriptional regulator with XRE-family HTH domain